ncbi:hypothetical protein D3C72_1882020 [compost metagenome]
MIATRFGGNTAFKYAFADFRFNAHPLIRYLNNQLALIEFYQHFYRLMRERRALCGFDSVIQ